MWMVHSCSVAQAVNPPQALVSPQGGISDFSSITPVRFPVSQSWITMVHGATQILILNDTLYVNSIALGLTP